MTNQHIMSFLGALLVVFASSACADEPLPAKWQPANPGEPVLPAAILAFGDVDEALVDRARNWTQNNLAIPVPLIGIQKDVQLGTFDEVAQVASKLVEGNRVGLVVLWMPSSDVMNHGAHFPEERVVIANLKPMYEDAAGEQIGRRVERQAIRGVCLLMGLEPSPIPQSVMFSYSNREELDQIGRNLDPPWLVRLQRRAEQLGIPVDVNNPFNMIIFSDDE